MSRYKITEYLSHGGEAIVYKALDNDKNPIALKIFFKVTSALREFKKRVYLGKHPHLIEHYEVINNLSNMVSYQSKPNYPISWNSLEHLEKDNYMAQICYYFSKPEQIAGCYHQLDKNDFNSDQTLVYIPFKNYCNKNSKDHPKLESRIQKIFNISKHEFNDFVKKGEEHITAKLIDVQRQLHYLMITGSGIAMQYIDGADIHSFSKNLNGNRLPLPIVLSVTTAISSVIKHIHSRKCIYQDFKPENIMIDSTRKCWLVDFGSIRYLKGGKADGIQGTVYALAPEVIKNKCADKKADYWQFAQMLVEILTGQSPFYLNLNLTDKDDSNKILTVIQKCKILSNHKKLIHPQLFDIIKSVNRYPTTEAKLLYIKNHPQFQNIKTIILLFELELQYWHIRRNLPYIFPPGMINIHNKEQNSLYKIIINGLKFDPLSRS